MGVQAQDNAAPIRMGEWSVDRWHAALITNKQYADVTEREMRKLGNVKAATGAEVYAIMNAESSARSKSNARMRWLGRMAWFVAGAALALASISPADAQQQYSPKAGEVIDGQTFSNPNGTCVMVQASGVTIKNSTFTNCQVPINTSAVSDLTITGNKFVKNARGIYLQGNGNNIKITGNSFDETGTNSLPSFGSSANAIQFNAASGSGILISGNTFNNNPATSSKEDTISFYDSSGTAASPAIVENNCIKGGGPSESGGGIAVGEKGSSYIVARNNTLVRPGQYGMFIWGGSNNQFYGNKIYSDAYASWVNVGAHFGGSGSLGAGNVFRDNKIFWTSSQWGNNPTYIYPGSNSSQLAGWSANNFRDTSLATLDCGGTTPPPSSDCPVTWADGTSATVLNGASVTAYQAASVVAPATCVSQQRTCSNGTLSGTYANKTCSVVTNVTKRTCTIVVPASGAGATITCQ